MRPKDYFTHSHCFQSYGGFVEAKRETEGKRDSGSE